MLQFWVSLAYLAVIGAKKAGKRVNEKNATPVIHKLTPYQTDKQSCIIMKSEPVVRSVMGVMSAAVPQPNRLKMNLPSTLK